MSTMRLSDITTARDAVRAAREAAATDLPRQVALLRIADALDRLRVATDNLAHAPPGEGARRTAAALGAAAQELEQAVAAGRGALEPPLRHTLLQLVMSADDAVAAILGRKRSPAPAPAASRLPPAAARPSDAASAPSLEAASPAPAAPAARFGAAAPTAAAPGSRFAVHFIAYPEGGGEAARALLTDAQNDARIVTEVGGEPLALGTRVEVALSGEHLLVDGRPREVQALRWNGRTTVLGFEAELAPDAATTVLRLDILVDGIVLAKIRLPLVVSERPDPAPRRSDEVAFMKSAFASYSSQDRLRVLDRVATIRIACNVDVFLDCHDLHPGEPWEENLARAIDRCDSFLLFWSDAAAASKWVLWEWQRALQKPGIAHMQFHPLENGVKPPTRLAAIHLGDPYMDLRVAERLRRAGASLEEKP